MRGKSLVIGAAAVSMATSALRSRSTCAAAAIRCTGYLGRGRWQDLGFVSSCGTPPLLRALTGVADASASEPAIDGCSGRTASVQQYCQRQRRRWRRRCDPQAFVSSRLRFSLGTQRSPLGRGSFRRRGATNVLGGRSRSAFSTTAMRDEHAEPQPEATHCLQRAHSAPTFPPVIVVCERRSETAPEDEGSRRNELDRCRRLANDLGAELVMREAEYGARAEARGARRKNTDDVRFTLQYDEEGRLALGQPGSGFKPLVVDFSGGRIGHRAKQQHGTEQVVKAAALPKSRNGSRLTDDTLRDATTTSLTIEQIVERELGGSEADGNLPLLWDLTPGLGTDAFVLALAGWRVEMFERSPVVAALLQDALDRARESYDPFASEAASRMSLTVADSTAISVEGQHEDDETDVGDRGSRRPAVVYLDPMFPQRRKKALAKKSMRMLQALLQEGVGDDDTREEERRLFDAAMRLASRKVVVKRPVHGPEIVDHVEPSRCILSKNGRFDVYYVDER